MIPRFYLARISGRVRWGQWEEARFEGDESETGYVEPEEPLRHPWGGVRWATGPVGGRRYKCLSHCQAELL